MRRRAFVQVALLAAVIAVGATAVAVVIPWLPSAASKERDGIDLTYWLATGIAIFIFAIVAAAILYSVWRFRAHPDDDSDGPPIHGHTGLEIFWTAVPLVLVTVIAIVSAIVLHDNGVVPANALHVNVKAQQFTWEFTYRDGPAKGITSPDLYMPVDRAMELSITSVDVLHSFWVPQFGQKQDAVPGRNNPLKITPTRVGATDSKTCETLGVSACSIYPVICTELCGLGHALMRRNAIVLTAAEFKGLKWAAGLPGAPSSGPTGATGATGPSGAAAGKTVFITNGCGSCHTLTAAGTKGTVGPDLDKLPQYAAQAKKPLDFFTRESIVNPNAYIQPGFPPNVMPGTFGTSISKAGLTALVQYLVTSTKGGGK